MLERLIQQMIQELSMEELVTTRSKHHYLLPFDQLEVEAIELERSFLLKGMLGACPQKNSEAFLLKIMEANLFGGGTRDAVIGLNEEGKLLTLSLELDYNSSFKDFKEKLEDFVSVMDFWQKEVLKHE